MPCSKLNWKWKDELIFFFGVSSLHTMLVTTLPIESTLFVSSHLNACFISFVTDPPHSIPGNPPICPLSFLSKNCLLDYTKLNSTVIEAKYQLFFFE